MANHTVVRMREFGAGVKSKWADTTNFEELEAISYILFSKPRSALDVHFHFEDGVENGLCSNVVNSALWTEYLNSFFFKEGTQNLWVHFVRKVVEEAVAAPQEQAASRSLIEGGNLNSGNVLTFANPTAASTVKGTTPSAPKKPENRYEYDPVIHPPPDRIWVTYSRWEQDQADIQDHGPPKGDPRYEDTGARHWIRDWNTVSYPIRCQVTHAVLINGSYGMTATSPCNACKTKGYPQTCRVYHPILYTSPNAGSSRTLGKRCSNCRLKNDTCVFD